MKRSLFIFICSILFFRTAFCQFADLNNFGLERFEKALPASRAKEDLLIPPYAIPQRPQATVFKKDGSGNPGKFYLKILGGHGFLSPGAYSIKFFYGVFYTDANNEHVNKTGAVKSQKGLGNGLKFGVGAGLVLTDFLNLGIDFEYLHGSTIEKSADLRIDASTHYYEQQVWDYHAVMLTPHVILKALARPRFYLYNKLGLLLTLPLKLKTTDSVNASYHTVDFFNDYELNGVHYPFSRVDQIQQRQGYRKVNYKMELGFGLNLGFGANFKINQHWRWFGEFFGNYSTTSPKSSTARNFYKDVNTIQVDADNLHDESVTKMIHRLEQKTTYRRGNFSFAGTGTTTNLGTNAEGYDQELIEYSDVNPKYTVNIISLGLLFGFTYRF